MRIAVDHRMKRFLIAVGALVAVTALVIALTDSRGGSRLPRGVSEIDVTAAVGHSLDQSQVRTWRITEPAQVKRVIGWFNSLKQVEPSISRSGRCYADVETFTFRSSNGSELGTAGVPPGRADPCSPANIVIGRGEASFFVEKASGKALIDRAKDLLGARFQPLVPLQG